MCLGWLEYSMLMIRNNNESAFILQSIHVKQTATQYDFPTVFGTGMAASFKYCGGKDIYVGHMTKKNC